MEFILTTHSDYDQKLKIEGCEVFCYSKKFLKKRYSGKNFHVAGETKSHNRKESIGKLQIGEKSLAISKDGEYSRLIYYPTGYLHVGDDDYIVIMKSRIPFLIVLLGLILGLAASVIILVNILSKVTPVIEPYNPLPEPDPHVEAIEGDNTSKSDAQSGGGSVSMIYTLKAELSLSSGEISMYFKNPNASNHDVVLELYVISGSDDIKIAKSGRIQAGYGLYQMSLLEDAAELSDGVYRGKYKVIYYNPDTGERALVESDITDLQITVIQ